MIECDKRWRASAGNNVTERKHDTVVHTVGGQQDHQVRRCHQRVADHDFGTDQTPCHPRQPDPHTVDPDHCGQTQMDLAAGPWHTHTHTRLMALCPGLPGWAGTRMVKPIWILLKQETVSGSGISWAICKSASCSRQITTPVPNHSIFLQAGCPSCHPTNSVKALKAVGP